MIFVAIVTVADRTIAAGKYQYILTTKHRRITTVNQLILYCKIKKG